MDTPQSDAAIRFSGDPLSPTDLFPLVATRCARAVNFRVGAKALVSEDPRQSLRHSQCQTNSEQAKATTRL
jgi:hypothetical protein